VDSRGLFFVSRLCSNVAAEALSLNDKTLQSDFTQCA